MSKGCKVAVFIGYVLSTLMILLCLFILSFGGYEYYYNPNRDLLKILITASAYLLLTLGFVCTLTWFYKKKREK